MIYCVFFLYPRAEVERQFLVSSSTLSRNRIAGLEVRGLKLLARLTFWCNSAHAAIPIILKYIIKSIDPIAQTAQVLSGSIDVSYG